RPPRARSEHAASTAAWPPGPALPPPAIRERPARPPPQSRRPNRSRHRRTRRHQPAQPPGPRPPQTKARPPGQPESAMMAATPKRRIAKVHARITAGSSSGSRALIPEEGHMSVFDRITNELESVAKQGSLPPGLHEHLSAILNDPKTGGLQG